MRRNFLYCILVLMICLTSCGRKAKVIPRGDMAKIYAEMFIADQRIGNSNKTRSVADTSFVYDPIFEKYGYTADDYRASMAYYINDATRYARILKQSASIIEQEVKELKKEKSLQEKADAAKDLSRFIPEKIYFLPGLEDFASILPDTLRLNRNSTKAKDWDRIRFWPDSTYYKSAMVTGDEISEEDAVEDGVDTEVDDGDSGKDAAAAVKDSTKTRVSSFRELRHRRDSIKDADKSAPAVKDTTKKVTPPARPPRPPRPKKVAE